MIRRATAGSLDINRSRNWRSPYTPTEIAALRADPHCILPNRTLRSQWRKCIELSIKRDKALYDAPYQSPKTLERRKEKGRYPDKERRATFRRRARAKPDPILHELRQLAQDHYHSEDLVIEAFATLLRLTIPAAEAFKLAKAEVNRTSAQPFRDQSFNPDIDYEARETGRQMPRASDIRAARGDGG